MRRLSLLLVLLTVVDVSCGDGGDTSQPAGTAVPPSGIPLVVDVYGNLYEGVDEAAAERLEQLRSDSRADQARTKRGPEVIELSTKTPESLAT